MASAKEQKQEQDGRFNALGVPAAARGVVATWLDILREWNKRIDLTAARTEDELLDLMLADALMLSTAATENIPEGARVVDVGSGAGAPGLALALLRPDLAMTLVEPLTKRVSFLRTVIGTIGRSDIVLVRERVEDFVEKKPASFDVSISRATLAPSAWIPFGLQLAPTSWVLLAREEPPAIPGAMVTRDLSYRWPLTNVERRAVRYESREP